MYFTRGFPGCQVTLPKVNKNKSGNSIKNCCYGPWPHQLSTICFVGFVFSTLRSAMAIRCCWRNWDIPMWRCSGSMGYMAWKSFCREPKGLRNRKCTMATHVLFRDFVQDSGSLNWWLVRSFDSRRFRSPNWGAPSCGRVVLSCFRIWTFVFQFGFLAPLVVVLLYCFFVLDYATVSAAWLYFLATISLGARPIFWMPLGAAEYDQLHSEIAGAATKLGMLDLICLIFLTQRSLEE